MNLPLSVKEDYEISTDKSRLDLAVIHAFLAGESYWAQDIPLDIFEQSIRGSYCFGLYFRSEQVGFARVVSDGATFGYLADVFIVPAHRGKGLARWLISIIMAYPDFRNLRRWMLVTRDAHDLYRPFGFTPPDFPDRIMQYRPFSKYAAPASTSK